ncbi:MAG: hypothetical protein AAFP17_02875 [Pseudomonadota bacterium]
MLDAFRSRAWRQRRRLALVSLLSGLAWFLATGGGAPLTLLAIMFASLIATALWVTAMPGWRGMSSGIAMGYVATALAGALFFDLSGWGFHAAALTLGIALGLFRALIMVSLPLGKLTQAVRGRAAVAMPPAEALELLINDEGAGDTPKWHPDLERIERDADRPERALLYMKAYESEEPAIAEAIRLEHEPGKRFKCQARNVGFGSDIDGGAITIATFEAEPHPRGALLTITEENTLPAALLLGMWIDDAPGDYADRFAAIVEERPDYSFFTADHRFVRYWTSVLPSE